MAASMLLVVTRAMFISSTLAVLIAGCGLLPSKPGWKVDVANADRPLIVSIATDRGAWLWLVPPGARMVLLDQPEPLHGSIELVDPGDCTLYDTVELSSTSFTIAPEPVPGDVRHFTMRLNPGADLAGVPSTEFTPNCSG